MWEGPAARAHEVEQPGVPLTCSRKVMASTLPKVPARPCRWSSSTSWHPWGQRFRLGCRGSKSGWA